MNISHLLFDQGLAHASNIENLSEDVQRVWNGTLDRFAPEPSLNSVETDMLIAIRRFNNSGTPLWNFRAGGEELMRLKKWLLRFGEASRELRLMVADFVEWLANGKPTWDAYRALTSGLLIALDKQPGVRPVPLGET